MTVAEDVLTAEKLLKLGVLDCRTDLAESLPGILVKESHAGVEGGSAPCLERMISDAVHLFENGKHLIGRHASRNKGLMRVTQDGFGNFYFSHLLIFPPNI